MGHRYIRLVIWVGCGGPFGGDVFGCCSVIVSSEGAELTLGSRCQDVAPVVTDV